MRYKEEMKQIHTMACPILLNYLVMSVFELLDKAIVGHYSVQGFAVVGIAASPIFEITGALGILSAAFNIMAAKEAGKRNDSVFEQIFAVSRRLALGIGGGFFLLSLLGGRFFFRVFYGMEGQALEELLGYFRPASLTVLQNMLIFLYSAYYRNRHNTKISLYSTVVSTGVNLFFDLSLVHGLFGMPRLGTTGAAWGSVIGLGAGLLVYQIPYWMHRRPRAAGRNREILTSLFRLYPPLFGQEFLESTLFVLVVSGVVARMGTEQMAVYSLLSTVMGTLGLPIYAYATAAQTYAYQSSAAEDQALARRYLRLGQEIALAVVAALCLGCFLWREAVFGWIVSDAAVTALAEPLLLWVFAVLLAKIPRQFYMGYLQGTGHETFVFKSTAAATIASSLGTVLLGHFLELPGVYLVMVLEFGILALLYKNRSNCEV